MFEELGTTCSREVAVSVRTPPKTRRWTGRAVFEDRSEEAGRASRGIERANTMTTPIDLNEDFWKIGGLQWRRDTRTLSTIFWSRALAEIDCVGKKYVIPGSELRQFRLKRE